MLARNHPAVWLFIRYGGLPGLFFAVTVLCALAGSVCGETEPMLWATWQFLLPFGCPAIHRAVPESAESSGLGSRH